MKKEEFPDIRLFEMEDLYNTYIYVSTVVFHAYITVWYLQYFSIFRVYPIYHITILSYHASINNICDIFSISNIFSIFSDLQHCSK